MASFPLSFMLRRSVNTRKSFGCIYRKKQQTASNTCISPVFHCLRYQLPASYCTTALFRNDVNVEYRSGLPVFSIPLPSRRESCEFTLKPITHTVGDFLNFLREEDGGIDRACFYTLEGSKIAKSTTVDVLLRSSFNLVINDETYEVVPPEPEVVTSENAQTISDVKRLITELYSKLNVEQHQLQHERELVQRLESLKQEIEPLEKIKQDLMKKADSRTNFLTWFGLGLMGVQFGVLARLTWWEYSWDIMEPVTYFVTYGTTVAMYAYFVLTKQEYTFPDAKDRQFLMHFYKEAKKRKLDVGNYNKLKDDIFQAESDLQRLRDPLQIHLPIRELQKKPVVE